MIGSTLGPYEIIDEIGRGGMATVFRARQVNMDRYVAVKIIHKAIAAESTSLDRFTREAKLIARLEHPHILPVYDYNGSHDPPYIVMRYLPTGTLKDILERDQLQLNEVAFLMRQIASALDYAHRQGVIHRDIKPSNIMVDVDGNVFLTDFGIARMIEGTEGLTASGMAVGTPGYMAPEQGMGVQVDGRVDIYALGVMLYELLTGQTPFKAETPMGVILKHINDPVPLASAANADIPAAIDEIIMRAMAKNPDERFQTAGDLVSALTTAVGATAATAMPVHLQQVAAQTFADLEAVRAARKATAPHAEEPVPVPGADSAKSVSGTLPRMISGEANPMPLFAGLAVVIVALIAAVIFLAMRGGEEDGTPKIAAQPTTTNSVQPSDTPSPQPGETLTPQPTDTSEPEATTPSPDSLPESIEINIAAMNIDPATNELIIGIDITPDERIDHLRLQIVNDMALQVGEYTHTPPPYDEIRMPVNDLMSGEYTALVRVFNADGLVIGEAPPLVFAYSLPTTDTPVPEDTARPTATETPPATTTLTPEPTATHTATVTNTPTKTPTATRTATNTPVPTDTHTPTQSPTNTATPTHTATPTPTLTRTPTPTDTPSPTPVVIGIEIVSVTVDSAQEVVFLDVQVQNEQIVDKYRVEFVDADTNQLIRDYDIFAPLPQPVRVSAAGITGNIRVIMRAIDFQGRFMTWPNATGLDVTRVQYEFAYIPPTPTPTLTPTLTRTPIPTLTPSPVPTDTPHPVTATPIPSPTSFPTPTPVPEGALPFIQDMEGSDPLDGWDYDVTRWQTVKESGNVILVGQSGLDSSMEILGREAPEWKRIADEDLLIDMRINLLYGDSIGRIIFRLSDNGYYALEMLPGLATFRRGQPGAISRSTEQILSTWSNAPLQSGAWYEIKIWTDGNRNFVYIDNMLRLSVNDTGFALPGGGGIFLQTLSAISGQVAFDDIIIQRPEAASEHFQGGTFPNTWDSPSFLNVELAVDGYIRMTEGGALTPNVPPSDSMLLACRLYSETGGFNVHLRESTQGSYRLMMDGGHMEVQHLNGQGDLLESWTRTNYYARGQWFDFNVLMVGDRLTIFRQGDIVFEENIADAPPAGSIRFTTPRDYDVLRVDDCLFTETKISATVVARFAFDILEDLETRIIRDGLTDWYEFFSPDRSTAYWWESDPGDYVVDSTAAARYDYYAITSTNQPVYRRFRREIDSTNNVFGNGNDTTQYVDSTDIFVQSWMRLPIDAPVGSVAWLGVRSVPTVTGANLNQYMIELEKTDSETILRIVAATPVARTVLYEAPLDPTFDLWHQCIIVALDERVAFFVDGRFIAAITDAELLSGTMAIGVENNTLAHFDDVQIRDTSLNY